MRVISGSFRGQGLKTLSGSQTRPTTGKVKEAVFSSLQTILPSTIWLDLFAGSGGIGIEALSRGAQFCWFVDNHKPACRTISSNLSALGINEDRAKVICSEAWTACRLIAKVRARIDIAYIDPPYSLSESYAKAVSSVEKLLVPGGLLVVEHEPSFIPAVDYAEHLRTKTYGSSAVSFFKSGEGD